MKSPSSSVSFILSAALEDKRSVQFASFGRAPVDAWGREKADSRLRRASARKRGLASVGMTTPWRMPGTGSDSAYQACGAVVEALFMMPTPRGLREGCATACVHKWHEHAGAQFRVREGDLRSGVRRGRETHAERGDL